MNQGDPVNEPANSPPSPSWLAIQRDLALIMAHDQRNPIAALMANLNFLKSHVSPGDSDALDAIGDMRRSAEQLLRLIENHSLIARLEAEPGGDTDPASRVSLGAVFAQSIAHHRAHFSDAGVSLEWLDRSAAAFVAGDPLVCEVLANNVVGNVLQHVPRGRSARIEVLADADRVEVHLADDGLPFGTVERDFTRDGQPNLKAPGQTRYGRGLGLYVVGLVVRATQGTIDTESPDGHGHLRLRFPRVAT